MPELKITIRNKRASGTGTIVCGNSDYTVLWDLDEEWASFGGEATSDKFLEYVDVEGVVQPILTIQINTREAGSVDMIIAEEGTMMH